MGMFVIMAIVLGDHRLDKIWVFDLIVLKGCL